MKRLWLFTTLLVWFVAPQWALLAQQSTVEQRLERLEQKVDKLLSLHDVDSDAIAFEDNVHLKFGNPGGKGTLLLKEYFVISHHNDWKIPVWVAYHLSRQNLRGNARRTNDFRPDPELPVGQRAELSDYRHSGSDRGHMAPAAAFKRNLIAMSQTFLLSNITPQTPNLNRRTWRALEEDVRSLARAHGRVWVFTGSLFVDQRGQPMLPRKRIGSNRVVVPTHFYKVILCEHPSGAHEMFGFIMPNQRARLSGTPRDYIVAVDRVEELAGLDFFAKLPDDVESRLESVKATNWPVN